VNWRRWTWIALAVAAVAGVVYFQMTKPSGEIFVRVSPAKAEP
jgi:hypothetical protein